MPMTGEGAKVVGGLLVLGLGVASVFGAMRWTAEGRGTGAAVTSPGQESGRADVVRRGKSEVGGGEAGRGGVTGGGAGTGKCSLLFDGGMRLDGVRVSGSEEARRQGMRGTSGDDGAMLFEWVPARGRAATMEGMDRDLEIAWLGVDRDVVGMQAMRVGGLARYRFEGWTSGAMEAEPGTMERAGIGMGSRLVGLECKADPDD